MFGLQYGKKNYDNVKPFSSNTGTLRTDRQTDRIAKSIWRVNVLTRDKYHDFRPISRFLSEMMQDRAMVTMEGE